MKRLMCILLLWAGLLSPSWAGELNLGQLMDTMRNRYPQAEITGRFNDWRTVSRYRGHAGLHYGYDIALPYDSDVPAAWSGEVVAIVPWFVVGVPPGGTLAFDTFFPSLGIIGTPQHTRVLEGEMPHPATGLSMRMYDTRSFDRVAQVQHSINELEVLGADGTYSHNNSVGGADPTLLNGKHCKVYQVQLEAGRRYQIDMTSD